MQTCSRLSTFHRHAIVDRRPIDPPPIVQLKIVGHDTATMMNR